MNTQNNIAEIKISYSTKVKPNERFKISSSKDAYKILKPFYGESIEHCESFHVIFLNRANKVLGVQLIGSGGLAGCYVDPKLVFQGALKANASGIILSHNHPSGNIMYSQQDLDITRRLKNIGQELDLPILDHLILTENEYYSFADNGIL